MSESLRDALTASIEKVESQKAETPAETTAPAAEAPQAAPAQEAPKPGRTAGRERDASGKLLPGPAKRDTGQVAPQGAPAAAGTPPPAKPRPSYPSTWKPDHKALWDKVPEDYLTLLEHAVKREGDYANGVSTYKSQWDKAAPIYQAVSQYLPLYEQHGIDAGKQLAHYAEIHKVLTMGAPQAKSQVIGMLMRDYGIDPQSLFVQGQDGKLYLNQQFSQPQAPQRQAGMTPEDIARTVKAELQKERTDAEITSFREAKGPDGKPTYPHFEQVKETMAGLLQAGIAKDLTDAYRRALLQPEYAELVAQEQAALQAAQAEKEKQEKQAATDRARRANVSPRTQTPSAAPGTDKPTGLRDQLAQQVHARLGGGRV